MRYTPLALVPIAFLLAGCAAGGPGSRDINPLPDNEYTVEAPDIPYGYKDWGNGLATKFLSHTSPDFDCSYYDRCSIVQVYAYQDCPSMVYISANILNDSETVVSYTNDSLPSLREGQTALMTLGILGDAGTNVSVTELKCY